MPSSSPEGKFYTVLVVQLLSDRGLIHRVVDVGAGCGTYFDLLTPIIKPAIWTGIEVWEPYIEQFQLETRYHNLLRADARTVDFSEYSADLVIFGDILEHMEAAEAKTIVDRALSSSRFVLVSIPIVPYPQEASDNPFERHVKDDWSHAEMMATFPEIVASHQEDEIGVYILTKRLHLKKIVTDIDQKATQLIQGLGRSARVVI